MVAGLMLLKRGGGFKDELCLKVFFSSTSHPAIRMEDSLLPDLSLGSHKSPEIYWGFLYVRVCVEGRGGGGG